MFTFVQSGYWRGDSRLLTHAVQVDPGNWLACDNLAIFLARQRRFEEATAIYEELKKTLNPRRRGGHLPPAAASWC